MMCKFVFSCFHSGKLDLILPNTTKTQFLFFIYLSPFFHLMLFWLWFFLLLPSAVVLYLFPGAREKMWDHLHVRDMNKKGCVVAESSNVYLSAVEKGLSLFYTLQGVLFFVFFHLAFFSKLLITWCHTVWKNSLAGGVQRSLWMTDWSLVCSCEGQSIRPLPLRGCDRILKRSTPIHLAYSTLRWPVITSVH